MRCSATRCLGCTRDGLLPIRAYRTDSVHGKLLFGQASICRCQSCGLVQIAPIPAPGDLRNYYAIGYRESGRYGSEQASASQFPRDNLFYFNRGESATTLLASFVGPRAREGMLRVLDIGAGFGHTLHSLTRRYPGSESFAVEISEPCVHHLMSLGVTVYTAPAAEVISALKERFDLIILSHVLEHLPDPVGTLAALRRLLLPGGLLYIEVPNIPPDSLTRYPKHKWFPRADEPHITFFSRETLRAALKTQQWRILFCETAGPEYRFVSRLRFHAPQLRPLILGLLPRGLKAFLRRQRLTKTLQMSEREPSFYEYGGCRLWLRSVSTPSG